MPLTCCIYELSKPLSLKEITGKLERTRWSVQILGDEVENKVFRIISVERREGRLTIFLKIYAGDQRLEKILKVRIISFRGHTYLLAFASKKIVSKIAKSIADVLGVEVSTIVIQQSKLRKIYEGKTIKLVVFDMVRVPGLRKVTLSGSSVADTDAFREYISVCEVSYVLFEWMGFIVGISVSGTVVCLSKIDEEVFFKLIEEELIPLVVSTSI
ncbi:MAG: hypothetical protein QXN22_04660 [Thermofilaceae archaeon]